MKIDKCAGIMIAFQPINWRLEFSLGTGAMYDRDVYIAFGPFRLSLNI
jgi:hypothetical protein